MVYVWGWEAPPQKATANAGREIQANDTIFHFLAVTEIQERYKEQTGQGKLLREHGGPPDVLR